MFFFHGDLFNIVLNVSKETPIINGGIPSHHPFEIGIFHEINTPFEATNHFGYPNNGWFSSFPNQKNKHFVINGQIRVLSRDRNRPGLPGVRLVPGTVSATPRSSSGH